MHYVCSDIHGQYDLYQQLLQKLNLQESDTLYIIGDVIDRGPDSLAILKDIMGRKNVELFLGNHELMMLDYYDGEGLPESWMRPSNGGLFTYRQIEELTEEEKSGIKAFVRNAWIQKYVTAGDVSYALHHSFWLPEQENTDIRYSDLEHSEWESVFKAVWYSPYRLYEYVPAYVYEDEYIHIIGHVPVRIASEILSEEDPARVQANPPLIDGNGHIFNIDGGCALIGKTGEVGLYCMSLEKDECGKRKEFWIEPEKSG